MAALNPKSDSIKYHKINAVTYKLDTDEDMKETRYGKFGCSTMKSTGWTLVLCLLAVSGTCSYMITSNILKEKDESGKNTQHRISVRADQCTNVENDRFNCFPEKNGANESSCLSRGCCWRAASKPHAAPQCFFPTNYNGYSASDVKQTATGITATLQRTTSAFYPRDVKTLKLFVEYQTSTRLRIRIYDPNNARFEAPLVTPSGTVDVVNKLYTVTIQQNPFNIVVNRTSTGATVFDTTDTAPLIFTDQFLQIATKLSTKYLYGLGEHRSTFLQDLSTWRRLTFWNHDTPPRADINGYGTHPFFLNLETGGPASNSYAHGVFLLNSNAGDVSLQPFGSGETGAITYRMIGGILDFYILLGPSPITVVEQYSDVIGHPYFPPFWSLGFHICKFGIRTQTDLQNVISRNRAAHIPYDIQWADTDYMNGSKDWTYDQHRYGDLPNIVKDLHDNNQRFIIKDDPAISTDHAGSYPPYDDGVQMDLFLKNDSGDILIGKVWPGNTAFPDFFHPRALEYLYKQAKPFHDIIHFDGLWNDMNEPSSFVDGSTFECTYNQLDNPPYIPATLDGGSLWYKTICPSAKHASTSHYNLHNMYGWSHVNATRSMIDQVLGNKRSLIIARSTFAGSGKNAGHWLGDNYSTFNDLYFSIPGILNFNLFGIPSIGADICGFNGVTTPELCTRWHQLGVFYPFMRNHASIASPAQDPGAFQQPFRDYMRTAIELRYRLLAVLYTAFYKAHTQGLPIVRPLFYLYPGTEAIDRQFMWNDHLLVSPVLDQGATSVQAFIPADVWYDFYTGAPLAQTGKIIQLNAPIDHINVHVRGGSILPLLPVTQRTDLSRQEKFQLLVAVGSDGSAKGELFWDDGESADSVTANKYSDILFSVTHSNHLVTTISKSGYNPPQDIKLGTVVFCGIKIAPGSVTVNGSPATNNYDANLKVLRVNNLDVDLLKPLSVLLN